jgi:ATP-binding cassette subfamily B (MDR/TAP) protein 1
VINLLLRFYDPQQGEIKLDGTNIKDLNIKWLRSQIGYVGQEPVLFAGSIAENILYGLDPDILENKLAIFDNDNTDSSTKPNQQQQQQKQRKQQHRKWKDYPQSLKDKIIAATTLASCHEFISNFSEGYDTDVGSNGLSMSGGQKQRIAIARALVKRPAVLLLDEATSALDASSEKLVQESIDALQKNHAQTTIVIAHRLSTIKNADKIAVVEAGVIVEIGSHTDLIRKNGRYADLVGLQMSSQEDSHNNQDKDNTYLVNKANNASAATAAAAAGGAIEGDISIVKDPTNDTSVDAPDSTATKEATETQNKADKETLYKIWRIILNYPLWVFAACIGAAIFGAIFPIWGLILAKTQTMFYTTDTDQMRADSLMLVVYFVSFLHIFIINF